MTWFYSVIFDPIRYGDFLNALKQQIQNGGDVGYSFYGVLRVFNISDPVLLAIHGLVSLFLIVTLLTMLYIEPKHIDTPKKSFHIIFDQNNFSV